MDWLLIEREVGEYVLFEDLRWIRNLLLSVFSFCV